MLTIGSLNLDRFFSVDHIASPGETLSAGRMWTAAGGKGLNQSLAAARAGARVSHAGFIGAGGEVLRELLADAGVDVSLVRGCGREQGSAFIQVDERNAQNAIVVAGGSNHALDEAFVDEVLDGADADDVVLLQNEVSQMPYILGECARRGRRCVLNPSPFSDDLARADLSAVSWLVVNEHEMRQITGCKAPATAYEMLRRGWPHIGLLVTLGSSGSIAYRGREVFRTHAFKVRATDTTGAGDTYLGYFVCGLEEGLDVASCMRLASAAAAIAVTRMGAAPSIPERREVDAWLKDRLEEEG